MASIADLILEQGRARAQAREAAGMRLGGTIAQIAQIPAQYQAQKAAQAQLAVQQEDQALRRQKLQMDLAATQREQQQQSASGAIIAGALTPDGKVDRQKVQELATQHGTPELIPNIFSTIDKWEAASADLKTKQVAGKEADLKLQERQADHLGGVGANLRDLQYDPATFSLLVGKGVKDGIFDQEVGDQLITKAHDDPSFVKTIADSWIAQSPTQRKIAQEVVTGREAAARATHAEQIAAGTVPLTEKDKAEIADKEVQRKIAAGQLSVAQARERREAAASVGGTGKLESDALDIAALNYRLSGQLPTRLNEADKTAVINRAARLSADDIARLSASGGNIAGNRGEMRADVGSLTPLQRNLDASSAAERTLHANFEAMKEAAKKVVDTGSPWLNAPLRNIGKNALGSEGLAALETYRKTVASEYAKIIESPAGAGALSESARKDAEDLIAGNATVKQLLAVGEAIEKDAANKRKGYQAQVDDIKRRIEHQGSQSTPTGEPIKVGGFTVKVKG